jgi:hypothetical protein
MTRLIPNPVGDLEKGIAELSAQLATLPDILEQLVEVNRGIAAMLDALVELRAGGAIDSGDARANRAA